MSKAVARPGRRTPEQQSAPSPGLAKSGEPTYVQECTDNQTAYEQKISPDEIKKPREFVKKLTSKYESEDSTSEEFRVKVKKEIREYFGMAQKTRQSQQEGNRAKMSARQEEEIKARMYDQVMDMIGSKREWSDSTVAGLPNQRSKKKSATTVHSVFDTLNDQYDTDGEDEDSDEQIAKEKREKKDNPRIRKLYKNMIDDFPTYARGALIKN